MKILKILVHKDEGSGGYCGCPITDVLPLCGQGTTIEELNADLKMQIISVLKSTIEEINDSEHPFEFVQCKDSYDWLHHQAIEAEETIKRHKEMYGYKGANVNP